MLKAWKQHNIACRKEAGIKNEDLETGLNYEENTNEIQWAKAHAKALIYIAKTAKEYEEKNQGAKANYMDILSSETGKRMKRRDSRD